MRHRGTWHAVAVAAATIVLAACGGQEKGDLPAPAPVTLPTAAEPPSPRAPDGPDNERPRWTAPFDDVPRTAGETFIGLGFPADDNADLSISGVSPEGETRWAVRTNPSCVGYGVTDVVGTPAAVILASDADARDGTLATRITANAYDVRDGRRLWGPSPVPGSLLGPGLIFGTATPSVVGGSQGERVMLAARSGQPVRPPAEDARPLYEHHGTGLFGSEGAVTAVDTAAGSVSWNSDRIPAPPGFGTGPRHVELLDSIPASSANVVALRWTHPDERSASTALHDLGTGRLIADLGDQAEPRTSVDHQAGAVVVSGLDQYRTIRAFDIGTGAELWRDDDAKPLEITLVHDGTAHGTRSGRSVTIDVRTGNTLASGDWPVPVAAAADVLIAPLPPRPEAGPSGRTAGEGPDYIAYGK
ncbi:pyrrolo-quinoline quinone [Prauserella marina]|uniref:Outer membrane protein assembly factor BamB, contains PQQ-like beta-propeller repeat n=1 Tax=Prauserella marina TaxID=530584 RepID=A0A222VPE1_9PSEU|nr:PQQ-binding-like beta-propeller repeat protein [Prauserella marina]ASR35754.1 pyrrolo-quinoline quinone [Prauserella marina]PWV84357.1 outer membrane protein assembly factor BamB [Prauserella marina]SDC24576.1 Outer membrane protein assembly factor BamB, contains PQQ-like beta-propeller repeat [Prauserella marina]